MGHVQLFDSSILIYHFSLLLYRVGMKTATVKVAKTAENECPAPIFGFLMKACVSLVFLPCLCGVSLVLLGDILNAMALKGGAWAHGFARGAPRAWGSLRMMRRSGREKSGIELHYVNVMSIISIYTLISRTNHDHSLLHI